MQMYNFMMISSLSYLDLADICSIHISHSCHSPWCISSNQSLKNPQINVLIIICFSFDGWSETTSKLLKKKKMMMMMMIQHTPKVLQDQAISYATQLAIMSCLSWSIDPLIIYDIYSESNICLNEFHFVVMDCPWLRLPGCLTACSSSSSSSSSSENAKWLRRQAVCGLQLRLIGWCPKLWRCRISWLRVDVFVCQCSMRLSYEGHKV